jgi:hypothetical protein
LDVFGHGTLPNGQPAFFHPDASTFGGGIYLSDLIAAAQDVAGVESVQVTSLERLGDGPRQEIDEGVLRLGPLEIAQVENDPNYPENGQLIIHMRGGR